MKVKTGRVNFIGDKPMELVELSDSEYFLSPEQEKTLSTVADCVKAYLKAAESLANGKYSALRHMLPAYLVSPGNVVVSCSLDGAVIRYEHKKGERCLVASWNQESLADAVTLLSQRLVRCLSPNTKDELTEQDGVGFTLFAHDSKSDSRRELHSCRAVLDCRLAPPPNPPAPRHKPFCPVSVRSESTFYVHGEMVDDMTAHAQSFITSTRIRIPVGWDCLEIFPFLSLDQWVPENAAVWAEADLLALVAAESQRDALLSSLDPLAPARQKFGLELQQFKDLLDSNPKREEELHQFLKSHPQLLCPSHIKMWSKLPLGSKATDFVFLDAIADYLLVEIERSTLRLFVQSGDPSSELNHACSQIADWKRYIQDNLSTVQREVGLTGISANPRSLVVIGRSASLTPENRRKLTTLESDTPSRRIMTYDDVYDNAKALLENMFGPLNIASPNTRIFYLP